MAVLDPGSKIGPYEIVGRIGAGGMGEVYRATDTKLGRDVAIKILPESFAKDPDRLARFEREAKTLASLNHPNIAHVYDFEDRAMVMELLEGESLGDRLASGALPTRKAIDCASQIARGLAAAHERGIIHRDLKPDNIFILRDGRVKILDFGLARPITAAPPSTATGSMTAVRAGTDPGTILGTVGYMAPEQVRAEPLDARADLFALGVVLYEMLTGKRAFRRETTAETMAAILKEDPPDLAASRPDISPALDRIVRHCLEKNPLERFQTARDVAFALDSLSGSGSAATPAAIAVSARPGGVKGERWLWAALVVLLAGVAAWLGFNDSRRFTDRPPAYRTSVLLPEGVKIDTTWGPSLRLAISPDGTHVAFTGTSGGGTKKSLWMLSLADGAARAIEGAEGSWGPFWSPDSKHLMFSESSGTSLLRADVAGGAPTRTSLSAGYGAWGADDVILVAPPPPAQSALRRTNALGAAPVDQVKGASGERLRWPSFVPGRKDFFYSRRSPTDADVTGIWMGSLDSNDVRLVLRDQEDTKAQYANGYLLFVRGQTLFAQSFDLGARSVSGQPAAIADGVDSSAVGAAAFSASETGVLVYTTEQLQNNSRLVWMDREGRTLSTVADEADYSNVELSPDGRRLAVSVLDPSQRARDIYIVDLARGVRQRLTFDPSDERSAVWSPDGRRLYVNSKGLDLYSVASDFTGTPEPVLTDGTSKDPRGVSPDGRRLLYRRTGTVRSNDLWVMPLDGAGAPQAILGSPFDENYGVYSPDGKSMAYVSDESGEPEVYVVSLGGGGGKSQISSGGGTFPRWRRDGREILYLRPDSTLVSVSVTGSGPEFQAGASKPLFHMDPQPGPGVPFDITPDGQRIIVNAAMPSKAPPALSLIINWPSLVRGEGSK